MKKIIFLIVLLIGNLQAYATTYYCDPVGGDTETGDGSAGNPWGTLESVRKAGYFGGSPISAGDTVKLETGFHGMFDTGVNNATDYVTIEPNDDAVADVNFVSLNYADWWHLKGLRISPSFSNQDNAAGKSEMKYIIEANTSIATHIIIDDCNIFTTDDTSGWAASDWSDIAFYAIRFNGVDYLTITGCHIHNVSTAIGFAGSCEYMTIEDTIIENIGDDGITGTATYLTIQDSIIRNFYEDENGATHSDCIQFSASIKAISAFADAGGGLIQATSSSHGVYAGDTIVIYSTDNYNGAYTVVERINSSTFTFRAIWAGTETGYLKRCHFIHDVIIRNNLLIGTTDPNRASFGDGNVQGMFLDGIYDGVIYNNVVLVGNNAWGISLNTYANKVDIYNNVCVGLYGQTANPDILLPTATSDWGAENVRIINNIGHDFPTDSNSPPDPLPAAGWTNVIVHTNSDFDDAADPNAEFTSWPTGDMSLLSGSNYIDAASLGLYPTHDIDGIWREVPDVGPYEYGTETGGKYILIGE
jgi:hypothetical protein